MLQANQQTAGLRLRQYLDQQEIAKVPTSQVPIIAAKPMHSQPLPCERPYLKVTNPDVDTISLVNEALYRFYRSYPERKAEIVLGKALRYLEMWVSHFAVLNYEYQSGDYDVMIRSV